MTAKQQIKELQESNDKLRFNNLMMKIHLNILAEDINSIASRKILAKYRRIMLARKEKEIESQN